MKGTERDQRAPAPTPAERLLKLAGRVRRLGVSGRCDPEQVVVEKLTIASSLARLARELEAGP